MGSQRVRHNWVTFISLHLNKALELPRWLSGKESACQCRRLSWHRFDPWARKIPCRRKWQSTAGFLPGKPLGQRAILAPGHRKELATEHTHTRIHIKALNVLIVFEVRTLPAFYPKEIIWESRRIFMCQNIPYSICNLKKNKKEKRKKDFKKAIPNYTVLNYWISNIK